MLSHDLDDVYWLHSTPLSVLGLQFVLWRDRPSRSAIGIRRFGFRKVGKVPAETGTFFFAANDSAIARTVTMTRNLPRNIAKANVRL